MVGEEETMKEEKPEVAPEKVEVTPEERLIIRSYPHVTVELYILGILALIFGAVEKILDISQHPEIMKALGIVFVLTYIFLALIVAFEFPETKFFLLIALVMILILVYVLLSSTGHAYSPGGLKEIYERLNIILSADAFLAFGLGSFVVLFIIWLSRRFNYWVIEPNQVLHKTGLFGKVERYPTRSLRFSIDISDVFEYILFFRSGKVVLDFPDEKKTIVLSMVPNVKRVEKKIQEILGYVEVE